MLFIIASIKHDKVLTAISIFHKLPSCREKAIVQSLQFEILREKRVKNTILFRLCLGLK